MSEIGIKNQCFGVEVEMTGITRKQAAETLAKYFDTTPQYASGPYDKWEVTDSEGKVWSLVYDSSIQVEGSTSVRSELMDSVIDSAYRVEMVSPKLSYNEMGKLQNCVRKLKKAGAKVNMSCGIHIHIDAVNHNRQSLKTSLGIMALKEEAFQSSASQ